MTDIPHGKITVHTASGTRAVGVLVDYDTDTEGRIIATVAVGGKKYKGLWIKSKS